MEKFSNEKFIYLVLPLYMKISIKKLKIIFGLQKCSINSWGVFEKIRKQRGI